LLLRLQAKLKRIDFPRERSVHVVGMMKYQDMESSMVSRDISVNPVERPSLTLHVHLATIARKTLKSGYYILNV